MTKIAYVINYIVKNGPSAVVLNLIANLDREEYDISLITLFAGNDADVVAGLRKEGVEVYECSKLSRIKCLLGQSKEFDDVVKAEKFDVLHTHGLIPDILSSRLKINIKKVATIHNNMHEDYLHTYGSAKSRVFIQMHINALKKLDECVCCSESVYLVMSRKLKNATYIRNGINAKNAHSTVTRKELGVPEDARVFLYAGVLTSRKNIAWLVENFAKYHSAKEYMLVIGAGEKDAECRQKANDHVKMLGFQTDAIAYMNISDVYISASKSEGFSISVLEALSCGLGLFLSDIPSHSEIINMSSSVYLGETFTQDDFAAKLESLREHNFEREKIMQFQQDELSAVHMTKQYANVYSNKS